MLRGLAQEGLPGAQFALGPVHDLLDPRRAEGADHLVLQVGHADVEVPRGTGPLPAPVVEGLLAGVAEAGQAQAEAGRAEQLGEAADDHRAAHRHHGHAFGGQVAVLAGRQRLDGGEVAGALQQHRRPQSEVRRQLCRRVPGAARRPAGQLVPERVHVRHALAVGSPPNLGHSAASLALSRAAQSRTVREGARENHPDEWPAERLGAGSAGWSTVTRTTRAAVRGRVSPSREQLG
ncbi:hypothetical protein SVIOM342S_02745 [Streptomyces violaceorubidus]